MMVRYCSKQSDLTATCQCKKKAYIFLMEPIKVPKRTVAESPWFVFWFQDHLWHKRMERVTSNPSVLWLSQFLYWESGALGLSHTNPLRHRKEKYSPKRILSSPKRGNTCKVLEWHIKHRLNINIHTCSPKSIQYKMNISCKVSVYLLTPKKEYAANLTLTCHQFEHIWISVILKCE